MIDNPHRERLFRLMNRNAVPYGAFLWTCIAFLLLWGPEQWIEWFWFARGLRQLGRLLGCVILCVAWGLWFRGWLKGKSTEIHLKQERPFALFHLVWLIPPIVLVLWILRDRSRTTGDAELFSWALGLGQLLRVPHAPLTQVVLNEAGRGLAYCLNLRVPDGVALCVVFMAGAFVAGWMWILAPLPWNKRRIFLWLLSGSSLLVLAFGQLEIYWLPTALETIYLSAIWIAIVTGKRWWLPSVVFPFLLLAGMWNAVFIPLHIALLVRQWKEHPERRGWIVSWVYLAAGVIVLFFGVNPNLASEMWRTLLIRLTSRDYIRSLSFFSVRDFFSFKNFMGLLNVILGIVIPVVPLLGTIQDWKSAESKLSPFERWFPWMAVGLTFPLAVLWKPWFGYERDVDLYSFLAPPLVILIGAKLSQCEWKPIPRLGWIGLFLLGVLPVAGTIWHNSQVMEHGWWKEPVGRLSVWMNPSRIQFRPREAFLAGRYVDTVDWVNALSRWRPDSRSMLLEFLDTRNIIQLSTPETFAVNAHEGWARDAIFWAQPKTVLIVDCWGRLFQHDGRMLHDIQLRYPLPDHPDSVVALARGRGAEIGLLCRNGTVIHGHQAMDEPLGSWTWRVMAPPAGIADAWPMDRAVDLAFDTERDRILILDGLGGLHVAAGETLARHTPPDFDEAIAIAPLDRGWAYVTKRGGCVGIAGKGLEPPVQIISPERWPPPVFVGAVVLRSGEGRVMLDLNGILHPIGRCSLYQPYFPDDRLGRFCGIAVNPDTLEAVLLDRMYQVAWVPPDVDGVIVLHQLIGAKRDNARESLEHARWAWERHPLIRERMLQIIRENPDVLSVAKQDLFWDSLLQFQG